ncbi:hypothetical protein ASG90_04760 [Nocardioides sp. Soil797]|nr:hypothetical protein ASG90_04760 [Nocardioides sp. Soil797]
MTPTIRIDHEVYEKLQEQAKPFVDTPNAVLRRLLELPEAPEPEGGRGPRRGHRGPRGHHHDGRGPRRNRLSLLVETGALSPGDTLVWRRPRSGEEFTATITDDGQIRLDDGTVHDSPSGAGKALNGYDANGWTNWRIERTGESLRDAWAAQREALGERRGRGRRGGPSERPERGERRRSSKAPDTTPAAASHDATDDIGTRATDD